MKSRNGKAGEPTIKDKLAAAFDKALLEDFAEHGTTAIVDMRKTHPEKYCDIAQKRITQAAEIPDPNRLHSTDSTREIASKVLQSVGLAEPSEGSIEAALKAQERYVSELEQIANAQDSEE